MPKRVACWSVLVNIVTGQLFGYKPFSTTEPTSPTSAEHPNTLPASEHLSLLISEKPTASFIRDESASDSVGRCRQGSYVTSLRHRYSALRKPIPLQVVRLGISSRIGRSGANHRGGFPKRRGSSRRRPISMRSSRREIRQFSPLKNRY